MFCNINWPTSILEPLIRNGMLPSAVSTLESILLLSKNGEPITIPEKQEYPELFPIVDGWKEPVDDHLKASIAQSPPEAFKCLEDNTLIRVKNINGRSVNASFQWPAKGP